MDGPEKLPKGKTYSPMSLPKSTDQQAMAHVEQWLHYRGTPKATVYWFDRGERGRMYYVEA